MRYFDILLIGHVNFVHSRVHSILIDKSDLARKFDGTFVISEQRTSISIICSKYFYMLHGERLEPKNVDNYYGK